MDGFPKTVAIINFSFMINDIYYVNVGKTIINHPRPKSP
jgi:hypothetical protein